MRLLTIAPVVCVLATSACGQMEPGVPVHVVASQTGLTLTFPVCNGDRVQMLAVFDPGSAMPDIVQVQPDRVAGDSQVSVNVDTATLRSGVLVPTWDSTRSVALRDGVAVQLEALRFVVRIYDFRTSFDLADLSDVTSGSYLVEGSLGTNSNLTITETPERSARAMLDSWCATR